MYISGDRSDCIWPREKQIFERVTEMLHVWPPLAKEALSDKENDTQWNKVKRLLTQVLESNDYYKSHAVGVTS